MASEALDRARAKYDAEHTRHISLKLNKKTDADILEYLDSIPVPPGKQGYIKALIRADMAKASE